MSRYYPVAGLFYLLDYFFYAADMALDDTRKTLLSQLPQVSKVLHLPHVKPMLEHVSESILLEIIRNVLQDIREAVMKASETEVQSLDVSQESVEKHIVELVQNLMQPGVKSAVNATGIILHTGLGRAPIPRSAQAALQQAMKHYCTLEIDQESGRRGSRHVHVERLLQIVTGAESACVVNNNAAAVLLVLNSLAKSREVIVSRGQLVEIGGSFRMPDVMQRSGALMVEVGTTNRTHYFDYQKAVSDRSALIQVAHTSNYKVVGFEKHVPLEELKSLCLEKDIPLVVDLGSGAVIDLSKYGLPKEPMVQDCIQAGADVVTFSGDKLLSGPQCGIVVGSKTYIDDVKVNPLYRTYRCDKMTYAVLEATLKLFLDEKKLIQEHPVLRMLTLSPHTIAGRVRRFIRQLKPHIEHACTLTMEKGTSQTGGGSLPAEPIPTRLAVLKPVNMSAGNLSFQLRKNDPPVYARITDDSVQFDFRTIHTREIRTVQKTLIRILNS